MDRAGGHPGRHRTKASPGARQSRGAAPACPERLTLRRSPHTGRPATGPLPGAPTRQPPPPRIAGPEFVGYDAAAAARAAAAVGRRGQWHPIDRAGKRTPGAGTRSAAPPSTPDAPLDDFEARLRAATEPLGYVAPPDDLRELEPPAGQTSEWSPSAAPWGWSPTTTRGRPRRPQIGPLPSPTRTVHLRSAGGGSHRGGGGSSRRAADRGGA